GPGGTTALDLWLKDDRFRFAVPAIDLLRRGDARTPRASMRGLSVDFLGWWLLAPFAGTLLTYVREPAVDHFVSRDGAAAVHVRVGDDGGIEARRVAVGRRDGEPVLDEETVVADPGPCGRARYHQSSTGLDVAVTCEGVETGRAPNPRAFDDP